MVRWFDRFERLLKNLWRLIHDNMYIFLNNHENILEIITYSLNFCNWWWIWALFNKLLAIFHHFDYIWQFWKCCPIILFNFFLRFRCFVVWNIRFGCTMTFWTWPRSVSWPSVRAFPLSNGRWRWWRRFGRPRSWIFIDLWIRLRIQSVCWSILTRWRCSRWCSRFNLLRLHIDIVWSHSRQRRRSISWFLENITLANESSKWFSDTGTTRIWFKHSTLISNQCLNSITVH